MIEQILSKVTPQSKILSVSKKLGNKGIKDQQGTTRVIYDAILVDGQTEYRFFEDAKSKKFPFTNLNENRLGVGEAMAIQRAYLALVVIVAGDVTSITSIDAMNPNFQWGDLSIRVGNAEIMKPIKVNSFSANFNKNATFDQYSNFEFDTDLTIPPLVDFIMPLRISDAQQANDTYLVLVVEGVGSILALDTTL